MGSIPSPDTASVPDAGIRIAQLANEIAALSKDVAGNNAARKALIGTLQKGIALNETPVEWVWRNQIMASFAPAALQCLLRSGIIEALAGAGRPISADELSATTGVDPALIIRFMRPQTARGIIIETAPSTYLATPVCHVLASPPMKGGTWFMFDLAARSCANLPRYFEENGWKNPDGAMGPFQASNPHGFVGNFFGYLERHPDVYSGFNAFMGVTFENRPAWYEKVDPLALVLDGARVGKPEDVLVVDLGGGKGHDLAGFVSKFPDVPGRLVLQDLPQVINDIAPDGLDARIERMPHDFFTEQPIKGARVYYFRQIFHDWPTEKCMAILRHVAAVMVRGYSKVLIFEWVLPEMGVPIIPSVLDLNMMALLNAKERTRKEWTEMLESAGLRVVEVHNPDSSTEGIIEAELA